MQSAEDSDAGWLVGNLRAGSVASSAAAARALREASIDAPELRAYTVAAGALPLLVGLLAEDSADARAAAAGALRSITANVALREQVVLAGALSPLSALLMDGTDAAKAHAAAALNNIVAEHDALRSSVVEAGAVPRMLALLREEQDSHDVKLYALAALVNLTSGDDVSIRQRMAEAGAAPLLVALMHASVKDNGSSEYDQRDARLHSSTPDASAALQTGVRTALGARPCASEPPSTEGKGSAYARAAMAAAAANVLANLARHEKPEPDENSRLLVATLIEAGVLPALVGLLRSGAQEEAQVAAAAALSNLAWVASARDTLFATALPPLVGLLLTGTDEAKKHAAHALGKLGHHARWAAGGLAAAEEASRRCALFESGAMLHLGALCSSEDASAAAREAARWAISAFYDGAMPAPGARRGGGGLGNDEAAAAGGRQVGGPGEGESDEATEHAGAAQQGAGADEAGSEGSSRGEDESGLLALGQPSALQRATSECIARACAILRAQLARARTEERHLANEAEERARELRALADSLGPPSESHGDVTLKCADGVELGASRFLLVQTCPYYRALFESGREARTGVVHADPDFSSAAHVALLRQLHSLGEAELPSDAEGLFELLRLTAKLRSPTQLTRGSSGKAPQTSVLDRVSSRCEAAMLNALTVDNCLEVMLHAKSEGSTSALGVLRAAEAFATARIGELAATPRWEQFCAGFPSDAAALLEALGDQPPSGDIVASRATRGLHFDGTKSSLLEDTDGKGSTRAKRRRPADDEASHAA